MKRVCVCVSVCVLACVRCRERGWNIGKVSFRHLHMFDGPVKDRKKDLVTFSLCHFCYDFV